MKHDNIYWFNNYPNFFLMILVEKLYKVLSISLKRKEYIRHGNLNFKKVQFSIIYLFPGCVS